MTKPVRSKPCQCCRVVKPLSDFPVFLKRGAQKRHRGPVCRSCKGKLELLDPETRARPAALDIATQAIRDMQDYFKANAEHIARIRAIKGKDDN